MAHRQAYKVRLRRIATGQEHTRLIFANDSDTAAQRAMARARVALGKTMVERQYGDYQVISSKLAEA
jgi:hypothetical protein